MNQSKKRFLKVSLVTVLILLGGLIGGNLFLRASASPIFVSWRLESFMRALETSGIEGRFHLYQFRGRNMAAEDKIHATRYQMSVTSSQSLSS